MNGGRSRMRLESGPAGRPTRRLSAAAGILALALLAAACGGGGAGTRPNLRGTIVISGSSTVQPISSLMAELFNEEVAPNVAITVDGPGTGDGFELFCSGETDVSDASRPIEQEEIDACAENGIAYVELEVAFDGITVMTNPENTAVECLNAGDLYALFGPESEGLTTWSAADGLAAEVGGTGGFPSAPLEITAPGEESGTYDAFIELSGIADIGVERGLPEDVAETLRKDYQASPDDNVILAAMEGTPGGLGFAGFAFAETAGESVKEVEIDGGSGCVGPSRQAIADASYPLSRSLYVYVDTDKAAENPALAAYVDYYLTDLNLTEVVDAVGYVALPLDRADATRAAWEGR